MAADILYLIGFLVVLVLLAIPLANYMAKVFTGRRTLLSFAIRPLESGVYRVCGINESEEMSWQQYAVAFVLFNVIGLVVLFLLQVLQGWLPLNPQGFGAVRWDTAVNTAISFVTNTNWQAYGGESTLSYLTQMAGLTVQNVVSAAIGIAVLLPLIRAFTYKLKNSIGNFWVDTTRVVLYVLLPMAIIWAMVLVSQGVVQTLKPYAKAQTLEGTEQVIAVGPAASQIAIKQLGSNGGGFFNANSAHPFENPTPLSNFLEMLAILLVPVALPLTFGIMINNRRQGWTIFAAMMLLYPDRVERCNVVRVERESASCKNGRCWRGQYGGQGGPVWRDAFCSLGRVDNGHLQWFGEQHARQPDAPFRPCLHVQHRDRGGDLRRRRRRPHRYADVCHSGHIPRGPHDRTHAGVSG